MGFSPVKNSEGRSPSCSQNSLIARTRHVNEHTASSIFVVSYITEEVWHPKLDTV